MTTPMLQQYHSIKSSHEDSIVLFRLGDFYEAFESDAEEVSQILGITLTGRGKGENRIPMAGIPHHALDNYLPKLVDANKKIAIVEQTSPVGETKLVSREVVRVVTPGTYTAEEDNTTGKNRFIAGINISKNSYSVAYADISTGEFYVCGFETKERLLEYLKVIKPNEILVSQKHKPFDFGSNVLIEYIDDDDFVLEKTTQTLTRHFRLDSLKGLGLVEESYIVVAGVLLRYLIETQKTGLEQITYPKVVNLSEVMNFDSSTLRNLEIVESQSGLSLFSTLDNCKTNIGRRLLYSWITSPLINKEIIEQRLNITKYFYENQTLLEEIRLHLKKVGDIPRTAGKIGNNRVNGRDLISLQTSLESVVEIYNLISNVTLFSAWSEILNSNNYLEVTSLILNSIDEECSVGFDKGDVIKNGFNSEIDELRSLQKDGGKYLNNLQIQERERTGISSLKIKFNKVFGYYIEISNTNLGKVPDNYIRKQTLVNGERFITEELKEYETKILSAQERLLELERSIFDDIVSEVSNFIPTLLKVSEVIGKLDVLSNFAKNAQDYSYSLPEFCENSILIEDGRHPVIERTMKELFIPNHLLMNREDNIKIITGPNMSGKSTFIRQIALISIMAQIGSFVPATNCKLPIFDRIFSRIGANDNLVQGESTFMVEMLETANILNNATTNSLIILDEIGRGTSTYDGVAIAWSIVEFIEKNIKAKTLFATHYHELVALEKHFKGIGNLHVVVEDDKGDISFTHKIEKGSTGKSYGIHVAKIAGLPNEVLKRSNEILDTFEGKTTSSTSKKSPAKPDNLQIELLKT
jgi:DNA mismatch repair protein MutS